MKTNNATSINFGNKFRTRKILSFISNYPLEKFYSEASENGIIKFMTGLDVLSKDTFALMHKTYDYDIDCSKLALADLCIEEMEKQNPVLRHAIKSCDEIFSSQNKDKAKIFSWVKKQLKHLGTQINIEPFKFDKQEYLKEYGLVGGRTKQMLEKWASGLDLQV